jgi:hypothetical protein
MGLMPFGFECQKTKKAQMAQASVINTLKTSLRNASNL